MPNKTLALALLLLPTTALATTPATSHEGHLATREGKQTVDVPLKHTDVKIHVTGHLAETTVEQTFQNPYARKIDAVYLFPLPTGAAVHHLEIVTAGRTLVGRIAPREEAQRKYIAAKQKGQVAALLTEERPNLFTQAVANLEPGAEVVVRLRYVQALEYERGHYEVMFPMVAGPRYLPKSSAATAAAPGGAGAVQPAILPPGMRSSHDISLAVELEAGVPVAGLASPSHRVITRGAGASFHVELAPDDTIPNKDFILRYDVAGAGPELALLAHRDGPSSDGSFFLLAQPPERAVEEAIAPRELIFVVDTSSSMAGRPLGKARELVRRALGGLRADDTFQIVRFDDAASALGPRLLSSKPANVRWALGWLDALPAEGGTEMVGGLEAALALPHDPARLRIVVLLTDGYLGNEDEVLAAAGRKLGAARLFSFGVGAAVNRYLIEELARLGRGAATVVRPDEDTARAVEKFYARIDRPLLTDLRIDWGGLDVGDLEPGALPDLFAGQPLVLSGHYRKPGRATVTVHARAAGRDVSFALPVVLPEHDGSRPAVPLVWARARIAELERRLIRGDDPAIANELRALALRYGILDRYTAFVVVDETSVTGGGASETVMVPVEVPESVRDGSGGSSYGAGFGMSGSGYGGGGTGYGTIGLGSIGTIGKGAGGGSGSGYGAGHLMSSHAVHAPEVQVSEARVVGSLDKELIRRVVRRHLNEIRFCYEKELQKNPALTGRVELRFIIEGATGQVKAAAIASSTLGNATVEACIADVGRRWEFAAAESSGIVQVSYPLVLKPSEEPPAARTVISPDPYPED